MSKYKEAAMKAVARWLADKDKPVSLFALSCMADAGARDAGKKRDLYESLHTYTQLKPKGWATGWLTIGGDSMLMVYPPGWKSNDTESDQLLLGAGKLRLSTLSEIGD
jgi:hypothetical protein